jgi:hypothetical protein
MHVLESTDLKVFDSKKFCQKIARNFLKESYCTSSDFSSASSSSSSAASSSCAVAYYQ